MIKVLPDFFKIDVTLRQNNDKKSLQPSIELHCSLSEILFTSIIWLGDRLCCVNNFWGSKYCRHPTVGIRLGWAVGTYPVLSDSNNSHF